MNILGTAVLATILLLSGLPMAQAGERYRSGITLYWSKGDVSVGYLSRYGSLGHRSHRFKTQRYLHSPRYKSPVYPRWQSHHKYVGQRGRLSHRKYFTQPKSFKPHRYFKPRGQIRYGSSQSIHARPFTQPRSFGPHRHFKPRGHIRHGSPSVHTRPVTQPGRFGYYRNFTRQSRSRSYGYLRGLGVR